MRSDCARCASTISRSFAGSAVWPSHVRSMMPCLSMAGSGSASVVQAVTARSPSGVIR